MRLLIFAFLLCSVNSNGQTDSLIRILQSKQHDTIRLKAAFELAYNLNERNPDSAVTLLTQASVIAKKQKSKVWLAACKKGIASAYVFQGNFEMSLKFANEAHDLYKKENDVKGLAGIMGSLGQIYESTGNLTKALDCWLLNYKYNIKIKNEIAQARACMNLGMIYKNMQEYELALQYLEKGFKITEKKQHAVGMTACLITMGIVYERQKKFDKALKFYKSALYIARKNKNRHSEASALANISSIYNQTGDNKYALEFQRQSLAIELELNNLEGIATSYGTLGIIYRDMGNPKLAEDYFLKAIAITQEIKTIGIERDLHEFLFDFYKKQNKFEKALFHHEAFLKLRDSIINVDKKSEANRAELKFQYEIKQTADSLEVAKREELTKAQLLAHEATIKQDRTQKIALWGGLCIVALFSGFLFNRFRVIRKQKNIIEEKRREVEEKNKEITDSINYAQRIQNSLLPGLDDIKKHFPEAFILFKPRDIVSGDFYWMAVSPVDRSVYVAIADCTGHGVPGGFMSMLGINLLNEAIVERKFDSPAFILEFLRIHIIKSLKQSSREGENKDGMDMVLMRFMPDKKSIVYAGAHNGLYIHDGNELKEYRSDKMPIGFYQVMDGFTEKTIEIKKGDRIYAFTDGYPDQFGGPAGKKMKYAKLERMISESNAKSLNEQSVLLDDEFENWKGTYEQNDDVCMVGILI